MKPATYYTDGTKLFYAIKVDSGSVWLENCKQPGEPVQVSARNASKLGLKEVKFCASSS